MTTAAGSQSPGLIQDEATREIFIVDGLESTDLNIERLLAANGIVDEKSLQVNTDKITSFLNVLLKVQRETYEKISQNIDSNLHKYLSISQTFSESKNLLNDNAQHLRKFLEYVDSQIDNNSREFQAMFNRENKLTDLIIKLKQVRLLERFVAFLAKKPEKSPCLASYCGELVSVEYALANEKCLSSFKFQQLLEAHSMKPLVREGRFKIINILKENFVSCWASSLSDFDKMAKIEAVFQCFNLLGLLPTFREMISENLLRQIAKATVGKESMSDTVEVLRTLFETQLRWLLDLAEITVETGLKTEISESLAEILLKGIFSKAEYFPVSNLEIYTENYQCYHQFCLQLFGSLLLPSTIKTHLKKKESLLYKSFVISVIKKLEGSLIQLSKHIETCKSAGEIEEYCQKKSGKLLKAVIQDLILRNISKDTITSTLLHRVFAIGLRTILRIKDFFQCFYDSLSDTGLLSHLAKVNVELCRGLADSVAANIDEIEVKLELDENQVTEVKAAFERRILELRNLGLCFTFDLQMREQLRLEDEVAGIALKLNVQMEEPHQESIIINNVKNILLKFLQKEQFLEIDNKEKTIIIIRYLRNELEKFYDKQIFDSISTLEINKKFSSENILNEPKLDEFIVRQKLLDLKALMDMETEEVQ